MHTRSILTGSIVPSIFHAAPDDKVGAPDKPLTLEDKLGKATTDLTAANLSIATLTKERDDANAELGNVKAQFGELTKTADTLKLDLKTANDSLATVTGERDTANKSLKAATDNIGRLEKLCDVKGVDHKTAVASEPAPVASPRAALEDNLKKAATPEDRGRAAIALREFDLKSAK